MTTIPSALTYIWNSCALRIWDKHVRRVYAEYRDPRMLCTVTYTIYFTNHMRLKTDVTCLSIFADDTIRLLCMGGAKIAFLKWILVRVSQLVFWAQSITGDYIRLVYRIGYWWSKRISNRWKENKQYLYVDDDDEPQRRIQAVEMRCYRKILRILYKDHVTNEEVRAKIQRAIGPHSWPS